VIIEGWFCTLSMHGGARTVLMKARSRKACGSGEVGSAVSQSRQVSRGTVFASGIFVCGWGLLNREEIES
jgi:hypothetical protein